MKEYSFFEHHMGTEVTVSLVYDSAEGAKAIADDVFAEIEAYERMFSRFLPNSELSRLNQAGTATVSEQFLAVVQRGLELAVVTDAAFNPLVQVARLGYRDTYTSLGGQSLPVETSTYSTDVSRVVVDADTCTITLGPLHQLDLGGVVKGYLADTLATRIVQEQENCKGVIVNIGGDIATRGRDVHHEPFMFMLYDPVSDIETAVAVTDASLVTSGTYARAWQTDRGTKHHIVDGARCDNPESGLVAASIIHTDGAYAEALAKLYLVRGVEAAQVCAPTKTHHYQYFTVSDTGTVFSNVV